MRGILLIVLPIRTLYRPIEKMSNLNVITPSGHTEITLDLLPSIKVLLKKITIEEIVLIFGFKPTELRHFLAMNSDDGEIHKTILNNVKATLPKLRADFPDYKLKLQELGTDGSLADFCESALRTLECIIMQRHSADEAAELAAECLTALDPDVDFLIIINSFTSLKSLVGEKIIAMFTQLSPPESGLCLLRKLVSSRLQLFSAQMMRFMLSDIRYTQDSRKTSEINQIFMEFLQFSETNDDVFNLGIMLGKSLRDSKLLASLTELIESIYNSEKFKSEIDDLKLARVALLVDDEDFEAAGRIISPLRNSSNARAQELNFRLLGHRQGELVYRQSLVQAKLEECSQDTSIPPLLLECVIDLFEMCKAFTRQEQIPSNDTSPFKSLQFEKEVAPVEEQKDQLEEHKGLVQVGEQKGPKCQVETPFVSSLNEDSITNPYNLKGNQEQITPGGISQRTLEVQINLLMANYRSRLERIEASLLPDKLQSMNEQQMMEGNDRNVSTVFIYSFSRDTNDLFRTCLASGEQSIFQIKSYIFRQFSVWSELPSDCIFITGGKQPKTTNRVDSINLHRFEASSESSMITARENHSAAYYADCLYVIGGGYENNALNACERYICSQDRWEGISPLPIECMCTSSIVLEATDCLYVIGGLNTEILGTIQRLLISQLRWQVLSVAFPCVEEAPPCFKISNESEQLFVVMKSSLYCFKPSQSEVSFIKELSPTSRHSWSGPSLYLHGCLFSSSGSRSPYKYEGPRLSLTN